MLAKSGVSFDSGIIIQSMKKLCLLFLFLSSLLHSQLQFSEHTIELGQIQEAYEIKGDVVVHNTSGKKVFLMRADAEYGIKIYTSKKTLQIDDTCLVVISFIPESAGAFRKKISLVSSDRDTPYILTLSGNIKQVKTNDRMACVYFGKQKPARSTAKQELNVPTKEPAPRDNSNRLPDLPGNTTPPLKESPNAQASDTDKRPKKFLDDHRPNNIIILVDVSSSMRDSSKLPLMKVALHRLIEAVRDIDSISFVTYASKVIVVKEAISGKEKLLLHEVVDSLKAKGMTAGSKAILISEDLAQKHFIPGGNNQIFLATDGEFQMNPENKNLWMQKQKEKKISLSTVAFGSDKKALKNLRDLANKGEGTFLSMDGSRNAEELLLLEVEQRSRNQLYKR